MFKLTSKLINYLSMAWSYVRLNFFAQMEYKAAFWSQVIGMILNNCVWIVFWSVFFTRFDNLGGWTVKDVLTVWSISAGGYGAGIQCLRQCAWTCFFDKQRST